MSINIFPNGEFEAMEPEFVIDVIPMERCVNIYMGLCAL